MMKKPLTTKCIARSLTAIVCAIALAIFSSPSSLFAYDSPTVAVVAPHVNAASSPLAKNRATYQREIKHGDGVYDLQIASRTFRPANGIGPTISLVGAAHIGTANFYKELQQFLDQQNLVLCEGVGGAKSMREPKQQRDKSGLQNAMATALGLDFQMNDIDYSKPNFQNCDMTLEEMQRLLAKSAATAPNDDDAKKTEQSLNHLVALMRGKSWTSYLLAGAFYLVAHSEKAQEVVRLMLVHLLGSADVASLNTSASQKHLMRLIVQERNRHVMAEVTKILHEPNPPKTIAIFYGAAHLSGMEQSLRTHDGYVPTGDIWFTAFGADLKKAGFSEEDAQTLDGLILEKIGDLEKKANRPESR